MTLYKKTQNLLFVEKDGEWDLLGTAEEMPAFLPAWAYGQREWGFWWDIASRVDEQTFILISNEPS